MKKEWWHDKVAYQIYPKSFYDSNGDGIGDLPGIISKLDYLKNLGVDIIWLSPVYQSPLADQGYDISDYYNIDPRFGTMDDMDRLLSEAKKRGLYIVMDLVVNHCSDEHEWFKKTCADPGGEYGQYFYLKKLEKIRTSSENEHSQVFNYKKPENASPNTVFSDAAPSDSHSDIPCGSSNDSDFEINERAEYRVCSPDGHVLPCNWRSYFGGQVWEKLPGHEDWYYLHVFHKKQPDLNWENPKVREEIYTMVNWWLDKGLAGFRIDAIINIKKVLPFRNYAPDRADGLCSIDHMLQDAEGVGDFLGELRDRTFAPHHAFTVGEVFNEKEGELPDFIGENGYFSSIFDFSETVWGNSRAGWHKHQPITPDDYRGCLFAAQKKTGTIGFLSNIIENHDESRGVSRYIPASDSSGDAGDGNACGIYSPAVLRNIAKKALASVYFFNRGLPWIYQGQEIGMENVPLHSIDEVDDIASLDAWNVMLAQGISEKEALRAIEKHGRDNARTPFQWSDEHAAGFTSGTPWLRVNPNYRAINLARQTPEPTSVFHHYQKMIALRKDPRYKDVLVYGSFEPYLPDTHNVIAYMRRSADQTILVISNFQQEPRPLPLPAPVKKILLDNCADEPKNQHIPAPPASSDPFFKDSQKKNNSCVFLAGYQTLVLELESGS